MRAELKEILDLLNVGYVLSAYETCPWSLYDDIGGVTCSAEVRMGMDMEDLEAEIQVLYDAPRDGKAIDQIMWMRATPRDGKWSPKLLRIRGEDKAGEVYDWETKCCQFFGACVTALLMDEMPDFDALLEEYFHDRERKAGSGRGGRKAPKAKMDQVLGMKKGGGF